jgi:hypothetical protein
MNSNDLIKVVVYDKSQKNVANPTDKFYSFINAQAAFVDILLLAQKYDSNLLYSNQFQINFETLQIKNDHDQEKYVLRKLEELNTFMSDKNLFIQTSDAFGNYVENLLKDQKDSTQFLETELQDCENVKRKYETLNISQSKVWQMIIELIYTEILNKPIPSNITFDMLKINSQEYQILNNKYINDFVRQLENAQLEIKQCKKENDHFKTQLNQYIEANIKFEQIHNQQNVHLQKQIENLTSENNLLTTENVGIKNEIELLQKNQFEYKNEIDKGEKLLDSLIVQSQELKQQNDELRRQNTDHINRIEMFYIQIQNLTIENESLKTLIYSVREENEILKREAQLNLATQNEHSQQTFEQLNDSNLNLAIQNEQLQQKLNELVVYYNQFDFGKDEEILKRAFHSSEQLHSFINQSIQQLKYEYNPNISLAKDISKHLENYTNMKKFFSGEEIILLLNRLKVILKFNEGINDGVLDELDKLINENAKIKQFINDMQTLEDLKILIKRVNPRIKKINTNEVQKIDSLFNIIEKRLDIKLNGINEDNIKWTISKIFLDMCKELPILLQVIDKNDEQFKSNTMDINEENFTMLLNKILDKMRANKTIANIFRSLTPIGKKPLTSIEIQQVKYIFLKIIDSMFIGPINLINDYNLNNFNLNNLKLILTSNDPLALAVATTTTTTTATTSVGPLVRRF